MCKMHVVINQLVLGNRELGWELFDGKQVLELTSKQVKDVIKAGRKVCGLCIGRDGELELDKEGFFTTNMTVHSHVNNWRTMDENSMTNLLYVCIGSHEESGKVVYDCVSSRFEQLGISESDMKAFLKIGIVSGGAKLDGEKIVLADLEYKKAASVEGETAKEEKKAAPVSNAMAKPETKTDVNGQKPAQPATAVPNMKK